MSAVLPPIAPLPPEGSRSTAVHVALNFVATTASDRVSLLDGLAALFKVPAISQPPTCSHFVSDDTQERSGGSAVIHAHPIPASAAPRCRDKVGAGQSAGGPRGQDSPGRPCVKAGRWNRVPCSTPTPRDRWSRHLKLPPQGALHAQRGDIERVRALGLEALSGSW